MPISNADSLKKSNTVDVNSSALPLSFKDRARDAANQWLAKNRSLVLRQTPVWAQSLVLMLILLGSGAVLAGIFFRIDEVVTATGQLRSIGGTIEVKTPVGGKIAEVLYQDGEFVKKGQKLIVYDTTEVLQEKDTLSRLVDFENKNLETQVKAFESRLTSIRNQKSVLQRSIDTKKSILKNMKQLLEVGGYQRLQYLERQDELYAYVKQLSELDEDINRIKLNITSTKLRSQRTLDQLANSIQKADLQLSYINVLAPIDGIIFNPKAVPSGVLNPGETIVSIVPQKGLYAQVFVTNKDIGYIIYEDFKIVRG